MYETSPRFKINCRAPSLTCTRRVSRSKSTGSPIVSLPDISTTTIPSTFRVFTFKLIRPPSVQFSGPRLKNSSEKGVGYPDRCGFTRGFRPTEYPISPLYRPRRSRREDRSLPVEPPVGGENSSPARDDTSRDSRDAASPAQVDIGKA